MNGLDAARIRAAIAGKRLEYFTAHGLGDLLEEAGLDRSPAAIRAAVDLLATEDDIFPALGAVSQGLREALADDDEYARLASRVAGLVRHDIGRGFVVDALVEAGKDGPAAAASAARRLVDLGDADYAAFLAGGAYAGATPQCAGLIDSLLSSGDPGRAAAGICALRVAHGEHQAPDAGRVADAIADALRAGGPCAGPDGEAVHLEAMGALLDIYRTDPARIGPMVEDVALRRRATRTMLADRITEGPPFDSGTAMRYMDICLDGAGPDDPTLHCMCCALASLAASEPAPVARHMAALAAGGWYRKTYGGRVMEELGRGGAARAAAELLAALRRRRGGPLLRDLPSMVQRLARHAGVHEAAAPLLDGIESSSDPLRDCMSALEALAEEGRPAGRDRELEHVARAGPGGGGPPARPGPGASGTGYAEDGMDPARRLRRPRAPGLRRGEPYAVFTPYAAPRNVACAIVPHAGPDLPDRLVLVRRGNFP